VIPVLEVMKDRYLDVLAAVDTEFRRNRALHGERIHCRPGCTDCCHHRFQITEIEAAYISEGIRRLEPPTRDSLRDRAREYLEADGTLRLPCPALDEGICSIYEFRPLVCHKFGMPLYNPEKPDHISACELNFKDGEEIDDPDLIQIQTGIHQAWKALQSEYVGERASERLTVARAILDG
jgi:Fe-S-cluster containining protein